MKAKLSKLMLEVLADPKARLEYHEIVRRGGTGTIHLGNRTIRVTAGLLRHSP